MKIFPTAFTIICLLFIMTVDSHAARENISSCLICHNRMSGKVTLQSGQEIDLRIDASKFQASVHGFLACTECHKKFDENPHVKPSEKVPADIMKISEEIKSKAKIDPVAYSACYSCHEDIYKQVLSSPHGKNITVKPKPDGALCLDCHGSPHYIVKTDNPGSHVNRKNVVETCARCHGNRNLAVKYKMGEDVLVSYNESFHGKKYHLGDRKAPTCISCHGYHDIKRVDNPASPVFGLNKIQTCGKCHKGANEKFVAAFTHKPAGPIPRITQVTLIILTLSVFIFIVSHVILEAYAEIRDAIFRKKRRTEKDESENECI